MHYKYLIKVIENFLPPMSQLIAADKTSTIPLAGMEDLDGDGVPEIFGAYNWRGENYVIVLKNFYNFWYVIDNIKGDLENVIHLSKAYPPNKELLKLKEKALIKSTYKRLNLYPASVKEKNGTKWGYINSKGQFVIRPKYNYANNFQDNGFAIVKEERGYGIIDEFDKYIVEPKYNFINEFSEGLAVVNDETGSKVINEKGKEITSKSYSYISTFKNSRAVFQPKGEKEPLMYGYLDKEGREVIPAKYQYAEDFKDGKAIVKISEGEYALIDLNENVLQSYKYAFVGNQGDGFLAFQENIQGKYGFIDEKGNVVIPPSYTTTQPFSKGVAVVNISESYHNKYGLIDKRGNFIIKPEYNDINMLGENRAAVGIAIDKDKPFIGSKYAIYNTKGNRLTDFIYYGVSKYKGGLASAYNDKYTFFIDKNGNKLKDLPIVNGNGTLSFEGNLIRADVDLRISYIDEAGNVIWEQNSIIPLNDKYKIKEEKFKPNKDYIVYYPQVLGITNKKIEMLINDNLKKLSQVKAIDDKIQLDYNYVGDFSIEFFKKSLLVLKLSAYKYYFGAAHGMPTEIYPNINLNTGRFYELKDLFKKNSNYVKVLSDIIENQIKTDKKYSYVWLDQYKGIKKDQPFYVNNNFLYIYFYPYEIAPYAAGFPTFKISYKDIMNIINTRGEFWQAFH